MTRSRPVSRRSRWGWPTHRTIPTGEPIAIVQKAAADVARFQKMAAASTPRLRSGKRCGAWFRKRLADRLRRAGSVVAAAPDR